MALVNILPSLARTAVTQSPQVSANGATGARIVLVVSLASGTGGLMPQLRQMLPDGSNKVLWRIPKPIKATGTFYYDHYEGADVRSGAAQYACPQRLPSEFNVQVGVGDASSYTYALYVERLGGGA